MAAAGQGSGTVVRPATPADVPLLLEMFRELAVYEHLEHVMAGSVEMVERALFGERPAAEALLAERGGEAAGYAVFFPTFSTFRATSGIWLEDLYVRPAHRKGGVGRALMAAVAARVLERDGERLEWVALDWNELALGFYERLGGKQMSDWLTHRLGGDELQALAREAVRSSGGGEPRR